MEESKRTRFLVFMLIMFCLAGAFIAQTICWYKIGKTGKAWTEHTGYKNETHYTEKQISFPFTSKRSCVEEEAERVEKEKQETEASAAEKSNRSYGDCDGS